MLKELGDQRYNNFRDYYYFDKLNVKLPGINSCIGFIS